MQNPAYTILAREDPPNGRKRWRRVTDTATPSSLHLLAQKRIHLTNVVHLTDPEKNAYGFGNGTLGGN